MARLRRYFADGYPQHLTQRGHNRQAVFASAADYRLYLECLGEAALRYGVAIHAWVLMTNHVHLLATPVGAQSIPRAIQSVGRRYVQLWNHAHGRTGTLWEGRYHAAVIDSERYLLTCMCYIELNPVRAGLVKDPAEYPWSSYHFHALGEPDPLVTPHDLYRGLGRSPESRRQAYRSLCSFPIPPRELDALRAATHRGWALGGTRFRARVEAATGHPAGPRPRGRPRGTAPRRGAPIGKPSLTPFSIPFSANRV